MDDSSKAVSSSINWVRGAGWVVVVVVLVHTTTILTNNINHIILWFIIIYASLYKKGGRMPNLSCWLLWLYDFVILLSQQKLEKLEHVTRSNKIRMSLASIAPNRPKNYPKRYIYMMWYICEIL